VVEIAYLQNSLKSWPAWRKQHGDQFIPKLLAAIEERLGQPGTELVLAGHSGGGSLIFGYLNGCETIPERVTRIAFLDSNYAYDRAAGHCDKLVNWLKATNGHYLCVLAYNDAVALLNGQPFVSASGGTWGKSHEMQEDLAESFAFSTSTNAEFQRFSALDGRVQFILRENPKREILHTVQVERNGFIHALLTGTGSENNGYEYFGPPAYARWIEP
jgi:hypothetical protein